jgi:TfoX/Sxy family transcriptional regulator of competence genes
MVMRGKDLEGYVVVEERVLDTKKQLRYWLKLALDYNPIAQRSKKKKQGRTKA